MYALLVVLATLLSAEMISLEGIPYGPQNVAVVSDSGVTLKCGKNTNCPMHWRYRDTDGTEVELPNDKTSVNSSVRGQYNLHILNASRPNAGTYICAVKEEDSVKGCSDKMSTRFEAHLVLVQFPKFETNISDYNYTVTENDHVTMFCTLTYFGVMIPDMKWKRNNETIEENATTEIIGSRSVKSSLFLKATADFNNNKISCVTSFVPGNGTLSNDINVVRATNIPVYEINFPPLNVHYVPRNFKIEHMGVDEDLVRPGDRLECHADGNPKIQYEWMVTAGNVKFTVQSHVLHINENMLSDSMLIVECKATNTVGTNSTGTITKRATEISTGDHHDHQTLVIVIIIVIVAVVAANTILCFLLCKQQRKGTGYIEVATVIPNGNQGNGHIYAIYDSRQTDRTPCMERQECSDIYEEPPYGDTGEEVCCGEQNNLELIYEDVTLDDCEKGTKPTACSSSKKQAEANARSRPYPAVYEEVKLPEKDTRIVYTDVRPSEKDQKAPVSEPSRRPQLNNSLYAYVDHNLKAVPPPPKLKK